MSDPGDALARFEALLAPRGAELLARLAGEDVTPGTELRLATLLRAEYPASLVSDALAQHELRIRAQPKFSRAMSMFFTRPGLEQASSELVSAHRARRYTGAATVADLCCGIGGDLTALAAAGHHVLAVDRDPLHLRMAQANAAVCGVGEQVTPVCADVRDADLAGVQAVFADPARRAGPRRLRTGDSEPPLDWCLGLAARVSRVGIKAAPGLPREAAPPGWELEFIAVGRELKEAVLWSPALATAARRATILPGGYTLASPHPAGALDGSGDGGPDGEPHGDPRGDSDGVAAVPVRAPGEYLYDPNPAVTRAGLVRDLARLTGTWQIDSQIAFLSADQPVPTPFARLLRVVDSGPWDQKRLPARLRALDIGAVDIRRRGLAGDTDRLHRQLKLSGSRRATLVMTRVNDRPWALVCEDVNPAGA
jgi:SAM-dependent methyltransferase